MTLYENVEIDLADVTAFDNVLDEGRIVFTYDSNKGWGQFTIYQKGNKWYYDSEGMGKEFGKLIFEKFLESMEERDRLE